LPCITSNVDKKPNQLRKKKKRNGSTTVPYELNLIQAK
jgi:glutaredoxin